MTFYPIGLPPSLTINDLRIMFKVVAQSIVINSFPSHQHGPRGGRPFDLRRRHRHRLIVVRVTNWLDSGWIADWTTLGAFGSGPGQFNQPGGDALDQRGRIYIADASNHRVVRVNNMSRAGWTAFQTGCSVPTDGNKPRNPPTEICWPSLVKSA